MYSRMGAKEIGIVSPHANYMQRDFFHYSNYSDYIHHNYYNGGIAMDYQKAYHLLFNAITDAIACLQQQNFGQAKQRLISAQLQAEALYLDSGDEHTFAPI